MGKVIDSGFINEGEQVAELNEKLSKFLKISNLVLTNSGTSALTLALKIAGVSVGDEVISISMTCIATNTPILSLGAKIVWADIDPATGSIDPNELRKLINAKTKAIMFVAWAGNPCALDGLKRIGSEHGIPLIQDAAHAFGAEFGGKPISDFADFTCFSFQAIKHFTTGDGGAIVCKRESDYLLARKLKWFGYDRDSVKDSKGEWKGQRWDADIAPGEIGYKFNMNNLAASIGLVQMKYIDGIIESHRENAEYISKALGSLSSFTLLNLPKEARSSHWVFTLLFNGIVEKRNLLLESLNRRGIGAGLVHLPNHTYSVFSSFHRELAGTSEFAERQISLPCGWWLTQEDCKSMCQEIVEIATGI